MKEFRQRLAELRSKQSVSQEKLADIMGITKGTIGNYESGIRMPKYEQLLKLADYFAVSVDYLLGRTENPHMSKLEVAFHGLPPEMQELLLHKDKSMPYLQLAAEIAHSDVPLDELKEFLSSFVTLRKKSQEMQELGLAAKKYRT